LYHIDEESHYQEIKVAHFDVLLQRNIVAPTVGYRLKPLEILQSERNKQEVEDLMDCESKSNRIYKETKVLEGSLMLWVDGLGTFDRKDIVDAALNESNENAIRYALFHYLGACGKTDHNHFGLRMDEQSSDCSDSLTKPMYVALDNDRCFQPKSIQEKYKRLYKPMFKAWKHVVYSTCAFPPHIVNLILETHKGSKPPLSKRLKEPLQEDILAEDILALHPESYAEIDERVSKLAQHLENCMEQDFLQTKDSLF
jgi:hypothetical protein